MLPLKGYAALTCIPLDYDTPDSIINSGLRKNLLAERTKKQGKQPKNRTVYANLKDAAGRTRKRIEEQSMKTHKSIRTANNSSGRFINQQ